MSEEALRKHNEEHVVNMDVLVKVVKECMPEMRGIWVHSKAVKKLQVHI